MGERMNLEDYMHLDIAEGPIHDIRRKFDSSLLWESTNPHTTDDRGSVSFHGNRNHKLGRAVFEGETFQQSYTGKNLFDTTRINNLAFSSDRLVNNPIYRGFNIPCSGGDTFTISRKTIDYNNRFAMAFTEEIPASDVEIFNITPLRFYGNTQLEITATCPSNCHYVCIYLSNQGDDITEEIEIQLEKSATATSYEPYVGGISSPNPDYPQPILSNNSKWSGPFWNQQIDRLAISGSGYGFVFTLGQNGFLKINGESSSSNNKIILQGIPTDHKYFIFSVNEFPEGVSLSRTYSSEKRKAVINTPFVSSSGIGVFYISFAANVSINTFETYINCIDLTQLFGPGNEPSTVEEFQAWALAHGKDLSAYQPYDPGTLMGGYVDLGDGWNIWDEEWERCTWNSSGVKVSSQNTIGPKDYIKVAPNTNYFAKTGSASSGIVIRCYDASKAFLSTIAQIKNTLFTTPYNCEYITFTTYSIEAITTYNHDICINLSQPDTTKYPYNGIYRPYVKPINLNRLGDAVDTYDAQNGLLTRGIGVVDLGTLNWGYHPADNVFSAPISGAKMYTISQVPNAKCTKYIAKSWSTKTDKSFNIFNAYERGINVRDSSYTTSSAFKAAMSGVLLYYELATPTTEIITPQPITEYRGQNDLTQIDGDIPNTKVTVDYYDL